MSTQQKSNPKSVESTQQMAGYLERVSLHRCEVSFRKLFEHFAPRLKAYAMRQSGNEAQAMEIVQDTLATVWQKAHLFNPEKGAASTWIFTIARNLRFDALRKQMNRKEDICADDLWPVLCEKTPDESSFSLDTQITLEQVNAFCERLPEKQRVVIEALYIEGKSQVELAELLEVPLGTVKSRTRLALARLKEMIKDND